jgi:hypothetical protein
VIETAARPETHRRSQFRFKPADRASSSASDAAAEATERKLVGPLETPVDRSKG